MKGESSSEAKDQYVVKSLDKLRGRIEGIMKRKSSSGSSKNDYEVVLCYEEQDDSVQGLVHALRQRMESFEIRIHESYHVFEVKGTGIIFIPVISRWLDLNLDCIKMLQDIIEWQRNSNSATNHILPIFFQLEPSDMRMMIGANLLREARIELTYISGWSATDELANEVANSFCQKVLHKLKLNQLSMGSHLVGIDHHVECVVNLLDLEVNDVQIIALEGPAGVGKTTLAKAVYHKLSSRFEGCSFLANIDERCRQSNGIQFLQAKMVADLLNKELEILESVMDGINLIRERFSHMKVLIVLDDVTKGSQVEALAGHLNWFGNGSRIIITSNYHDVVPPAHCIYDISLNWQIDYDKALQLLSKHTSRKDYPLQHLDFVSWDFVEMLRWSGSSALAIEILGSLLYGKTAAKWEEILLNLDEQLFLLYVDVKRILRMSYDSLNDKQKEMFLDISCFPDGMDRRFAILLWYNSLDSPSFHDFEVLICLCLVKVDAHDVISMHRVIKDFGREIIYREGLLTKRKAGDFEDMARIRFFKLNHANISGNVRNSLLMEQRDLIWQWFPLNLLATNLHSKYLKVLDFSWSKITEDWVGWQQIEVPELRALNLTGCSDMLITPNFSFCPGLEMLILEHCSRLVKVDPSIHELQHLVTLNLRYCTELNTLPKEVGCLRALKELFVDGTSLQEIPISIGHLKSLESFTAINCFSLTHLPSSTCDLQSVTVLKLECANITKLPSSIGKIMRLQHLSLRDCRYIKSLIPFDGEVKNSLLELDVSGTSISELPRSFVNLKNLKVLKMDFCFIREFPPRFGELKNLNEIHASWCRKLEDLPNDIGRLESLRILKVGHSCISSVPKSIRLLVLLQTLDFTSCNKLQSLPQLPSGLMSLHVQSSQLKMLPDLSNLKKVKELTLNNGDIWEITSPSTVLMTLKRSVAINNNPLHWLPELYSLRTLELCLPQVKGLPRFPECLRKIKLCCTKLEHIPPLPSKLVVLSIHNCTSLREFPGVESLQNLIELEILHCMVVKKIKGLERLQGLRILRISDCGIESLDGLDKLTSLTRLTIQDCRLMKELRIGEILENLLEMELLGCKEIKKIEGLERLQALQVLTVSDCGLELLDGLERLTTLRRLTLSDCGPLHRVPDLSDLTSLEVKCVLYENPH